MTINPASLPTVPPSPQDGLPLQVTVGELPVGTIQKVGDYKILGTLGSGGMGIVYKAFDQKLGRIVALKMLQMGREASHEEILRFRTEAEMLGRLQHPNIVQVFDFGIHDGAPFLVMEFVNGGSLEKRLQGTPQQPRRAAEWLEQIARAMHVAHENKVIHRDLKPANVLITLEGAPKITDFGLAKQMEASHGLTQTGAIMGTPSYMAPEQAEGKKDVGPPADIYSLGALLYECLTGRPPFRGATLQETLEQVCNADPAPPSRLVPRLPRDLQTICLKCLEKAPGRRYRSAGELADDLKSWLDGLPVKARPTHSIERMIRIVMRRPLRAALVAASLLVVVLAAILWIVVREQDKERKANQRELAYQLEVTEQKEETEKARLAEENVRKTLQNLKDTMKLMRGDRNNPAGLEELEKKLDEQVAALKGEADNAEKALVLAEFYFDMAGHWRGLGEVDRALHVLNRAEELADLGAKRADLESQMKRAKILQERGLLRSDSGSPKAVEDCRKALALLDEVKEAGEGKPDFMRLRAEALHDLAVATASQTPENDAARRKNEEEAQKAYLAAEKLLRALVERKGVASEDDRRNLVRTLGYLGDLYLDSDSDKRQEADEVYWESHRIREKLADEKPRDYERKYQLARSWANFGGYQTRLRILGSALHFLQRSEKLRRDLHQKQPDNKEYTLEFAGVLNRMAELELFAAEQGRDLKRLSGAEERLRECETVLKDLLKVLLEESKQNKEVIPRAYAPLGECYALQARAGLIRRELVRDDAEALERARASARSASDAYQKVRDRRALSHDELYQEVAAKLLSLEIYRQVEGKNAKELADLYKQHADTLKKAVNGSFRRLSREEIWRDRAFRSVRDQGWFKSLTNREGQNSGARAAAKDGELLTDRPSVKQE